MVRLVFTEKQLSELLGLLAQAPGQAWCSVGCHAAGNELLCRAVLPSPPSLGRGLVARAFHSSLEAWPAASSAPSELGALAVGYGAEAGKLTGWVRWQGAVHALRQVRVLAPSLPDIGILPSSSAPGKLRERLARIRGAMGDATWERLVGLSYGAVGVGRTGSQLALELARLGVTRLTLIDPDRLELHNLGEMALPAQGLGRHKVEAVADAVRQVHSEASPVPLAVSVTSRVALKALADVDCVFCCVDDDAARLAVTGVAAAYLKPCVHVGTGVFGAGADREAGADICLTLGDSCLLCMGGIEQLEEARQRLATGWPGRWVGDWRAQRAGSLRSVNLVAVGAAIQLWTDFLAGSAQASRLLLHVGPAGRFTAEHTPAVSNLTCTFCQRRGMGDDALLRAQ